jgi:hypothetical protein
MTHAIQYLERSIAILQRWVSEAKGGMFRKPKPLNLEYLKRDVENFRGWADDLRKYADELDELAKRFEAQIKTGQFSVDTLDKELKALRKIIKGEIG